MAELLRVKADVTVLQGTPDADAAAEVLLEQSLDWARESEALAWELRTAISLCRLRYSRKEPDRRRASLASVHGRFVEGFHTFDMRAARQLLAV